MYFQPAGHRLPGAQLRLSAPIDVQIDGPDVEASYAVARELLGKIRAIPGATDVRIPQVLAYPALRVDVDGRTLPRSGSPSATWRTTSWSASPQLAGRASFWLNPKNNVNYPGWYRLRFATSIRSPRSWDAARPRGGADLFLDADSGRHAHRGASYLGQWPRLRPATGLSMINHRLGAAGGGRASQRHRSRPGRSHPGHPEGDPQPRQAPRATHVTLRGQSESMFAAFGRHQDDETGVQGTTWESTTQQQVHQRESPGSCRRPGSERGEHASLLRASVTGWPWAVAEAADRLLDVR